jgi:hypothetical protein
MGREIKRVPLDFKFPLDKSFADWAHDKHFETCSEPDKDACYENCDFSWSSMVPNGEGWQLWQTVSDGPITPVFKTADELIDFMCQPETDPDKLKRSGGNQYPSMPWSKGWRREVAEDFVNRQGWAPSMVSTSSGLVDGATAGFMLKDEP